MNIPNLGNLMKQAKEMKSHMEQIERELNESIVVGKSGAGLVEVTMTGRGNCNKLWIDETLLKESKEVIEDLIVAAINNASEKISQLKSEKVGKNVAGFSLPPGMDSLFKS